MTSNVRPTSSSLMFWAAFAIACALVTVIPQGASACDTLGECPSFALTNLAGNYTNYSYTSNWTIIKRTNGPTPADNAACRDTSINADGTWSTTCTWSLNCSAHNGSVVFRKLHVALKEGGTVQVSNFSIWNYNVLSTPLISISNLFIPRDSYSPLEYTYAPDTLITGSSGHEAEVSLTVSSAQPAAPIDYEVDVFLNFTCSRVYRYVFVELTPDLPNDGGFWSIFAAYIIPGIITIIIIIIALLRYCNPDLTMSLKKWAGFKELDDEARTRHAKIKDRAGGGTWHDHAAEVVSDLQKNKIDETQARTELVDSSDEEELGTFTPVKAPAKGAAAKKTLDAKKAAPAKPAKEQSGDSIDLDLDDVKPSKGRAGVAPPKRAVAKSSDDDLNFSDSSEGKKSDSSSDDDDDVL